MAEWTNPIFYPNALGLLGSSFALWGVRRQQADGRWAALLAVLVFGTGLHFVGDLFGASEDLDHLFIHAILALAVAVPAVAYLRER
ncbi:MAG TPA: hypothetical protein VI796_02195 [Candidatus Thermoplasmatota archaeon]|nr:hypothetical protein [Candidatus Thermoplasmatota archaeon]